MNYECPRMSILLLLLFSPGLLAFQDLDESYWKKVSAEDLRESLGIKQNKRVAKNVILFIGDGMGPNTVTAARIYKEREQGYLSWERFDHVGALKTYSHDKQVPDSGCSGTAMFAGVKTNIGTLGVHSTVKKADCDSSAAKENHVVTIAKLAQDAGKATGIVTTARITHATPAAMYAHSSHRDWECDTKMPYTAEKCKDIARQLIEDEPGKNFNVLMGGGRQQLVTDPPSSTNDPIAEGSQTCKRLDGLNLIAEWTRRMENKGARFALPKNRKELLDLDTSKTDYVLGIFCNDHFPYFHKVNHSDTSVPTLEEMTTKAIKVLNNNVNGFFLMVESGLIDQGHHIGKARIAFSETVQLSIAVNSTMRLLEAAGIKDETLVIVTSDHSHTLTISGYPDRGNDILGFAGNSEVDKKPYTTLSYAVAGKSNFKMKVENGTLVRQDLSKVDTTAYEFGAQSAVLHNANGHGGSDVFVYATGPNAYLFHRMHEQTYIAEVIKYALRIGHHTPKPILAKSQRSGSSPLVSSVILLIVAQLIFRLKSLI
ncbi:alkaline phosphatase [Halyomorpha halys]|uniref:alkaline phosphatase n=1 Tax=Halyomorpha halys TaxID=286706 RepID=UPI0006D4D41E|nr:alkaline phosphatase-like [Halyomorpha halys]